jgi:hypothetical protein
MRQGSYLNVILTVNAVLLAGVLWTHVAGTPVLNSTANAQSPVGGTGIPNAADQRQKQIEAIRELKVSVDATNKLLTSGKLKVEVSNIDALKSTDKK